MRRAGFLLLVLLGAAASRAGADTVFFRDDTVSVGTVVGLSNGFYLFVRGGQEYRIPETNVVWVQRSAPEPRGELFAGPFARERAVFEDLDLAVSPFAGGGFYVRDEASASADSRVYGRLTYQREERGEERASYLRASTSISADYSWDESPSRTREHADFTGDVQVFAREDRYLRRTPFFFRLGPGDPSFLEDDAGGFPSVTREFPSAAESAFSWSALGQDPSALLSLALNYSRATPTPPRGRDTLVCPFETALTVGGGWGRLVPLTSLRRALIVERRLREAGVLHADLSDEDLRRIAAVLENRSLLRDPEDDRSARLFYGLLQEAIEKSGKTGPLGFYEAASISTALSYDPVEPRFRGLRAEISTGTWVTTSDLLEESPASLAEAARALLFARILHALPLGLRWQILSAAALRKTGPSFPRFAPLSREGLALSAGARIAWDADMRGIIAASVSAESEWPGQEEATDTYPLRRAGTWRLGFSWLRMRGYAGTIRWYANATRGRREYVGAPADESYGIRGGFTIEYDLL